MAKKLIIESIQDDSQKELNFTDSPISDFELKTTLVAGSLASNAKELKAKIENELQNYTIEKYLNNPDSAKKDKALLNKVKDSVADRRKEITKAWNQPLDEFLSEMKSIEKSISDATGKIAEITKAAEDKEKSEKREKIEGYWKTLDFGIVPLDRIFNPKWLNKTYDMKQIMLDCETITEKITTELSTIRSMKDEDSEFLQSFYLDTLDLNATLQRGNQLKANRETLRKAEEKNNPAVEEKPAITTVTTSQNAEKNGYPANDPMMDYNLILHGPKSKLIMVRKYMESIGVTYTKVVQ